MRKTKWNYDTCYEEAKKYTSRGEFKKGSNGAYVKAHNTGWINDYTWLPSKVKPNGYWTYEICYKEAKNYISRSEFKKGSRNAYEASWKNGWLDDYTWFKKYQKPWTYDTCYEEAKKYTSRGEFNHGSGGAYEKARDKCWLDDYTWLVPKVKPNGYWSKERCYEEAKKYTSRGEFKKGSNGAYKRAYDNGWLDDYTWFIDKRFDLYKDKIDLVYAYEFPEYNSVYVGRTLIKLLRERHRQHTTREKETTYKFCKEHNIIHPEPKILESDLLLKEGSEREGYWKNWYIEQGWKAINKTKTGGIGGLSKGKWNYNNCYEEAKKYTYRGEFAIYSHGAYNRAYKDGWLDDYTWLVQKIKPSGYWSKERCYEEAKKYTSRGEFNHGSGGAYIAALKNGWIDDYTWFIKKHKEEKWTLEKCKEVAIKYTRASDFKNNNKGCYEYARIHGLLNELVYKGKGTTNGSPTPSATLPIQLELAFEYA